MIPRLHRIWMRITHKGKVVLSVLAVYISVTGLVTFSLFIVEESIQTAMFGTWQAIDAKDWRIVMFGADRIRDANQLLISVNYSFGWIQPLSFFAYRAYGQATDAYLQGLEAKIFANAPELFEGRKITASFTPREVSQTPDGYAHVNHRVCYLSKEKHPVGISRPIKGVLSLDGNRVVITEPDATPDDR
jgi:hypothetical protein